MLESKGLYLRPWRLHLVEDLRQERWRPPTARLLDPPRTRRHIRFFLVWTFFPATKLTNHTSCLPDDQTGGIISHNNRNPMSSHLVIGHSAYENWRLGSWICWKDVTYLTVPSVPAILFMMHPFPSLDELRKQFVVALSLFLRFLLVTIMKKLDDVFLHAILTVNLWM